MLTEKTHPAEQDNPYGGHRGDMALPLSKAARTPKARANKPRGANIVSYIDIGIEDRLDPCPELYPRLCHAASILLEEWLLSQWH
jgi:hypothetical protein